jgi:hypothetical protein
MTKKRSNYKSKCCGTKVRVESSPDDIDKKGCTMYYVCTKCNQPCDVLTNERRTWAINPKTRIVPNKKEKNKKLFTDKELKDFRMNEDF